MLLAELLPWLPLIEKGIPLFVSAYQSAKAAIGAKREPTPDEVGAIMDGVEIPDKY